MDRVSLLYMYSKEVIESASNTGSFRGGSFGGKRLETLDGLDIVLALFHREVAPDEM
jgi:hypothetical protein